MFPLFIYFVYFSTLARPRIYFLCGGEMLYFSAQTNWHAQWDMVLLPSLLRNNGRRPHAHVFSNIQVVLTMVLF